MSQRITVPTTWGGVSRQPPPLRHANQAAEGDNVLFSVVDGASKRPGTEHVAEIPGLASNTSYRIHAVERSDTERYLIIYGKGTLAVYDDAGRLQTLTISAAAQAYLDRDDLSPDDPNVTADDMALTTVADHTIILNKKVALNTVASSRFAVTSTFDDYEEMILTAPAADTYHRTRQIAAGNPAGYYLYTPFKVHDEDTANAAVTSGNAVVQLPGGTDLSGIKIKDQIRIIGRADGKSSGEYFDLLAVNDGDDQVTVSPTPSSGSSSHAWSIGSATFATWESARLYGDWLGTPFPTTDVSFYNVGGRNPWTFRITFTPPGGPAEVHDITGDFRSSTFADLAAVAAAFDAQLKIAESNAVFEYDATLRRFRITSPYAGAGSTVAISKTPNSNAWQWYGKGLFKGQATEGTGDPATGEVEVIDRWSRVTAPDQLEATPDAGTLPIKLVRAAAAFYEDGSRSESTWEADTIDWESRLSGDTTTNPKPSIFGDDDNRLFFLSDISFFQNRLCLVGGEHVVLSQAGASFNLWIDDAENIVDTDPIDVSLSSDAVTIIDSIVPFRKALLIMTLAGRQFELSSGNRPLTPSTVAITPTTANDSLNGVRGAKMRHQFYFVGERKQSAQMYEYFFDESQATNIAHDVTAHVFDYVPTDIRTVAASPNNNAVFLLPTDGTEIFSYRTHWLNERRVQLAWSKYKMLDTASA